MRFVIALATASLLVALATARAAQNEPPGQPTPARQTGPVKPPVKLKHVAPVYPAEAQSKRIEGVVILELTIDPAGKVTMVNVLRSIPALDQAAVDAVRQWEFAPTLLNGKPTAVTMDVSLTFSLAPGGVVDASRSSSVPTECVADAALTSAQPARLTEAIRFARDVVAGQRLAMIETQSKSYRSLSELKGLPPLPDGFEVQLTVAGDAYALAVVDRSGMCGAGVFSDQRGGIYVGWPVGSASPLR
jgi:TonB family protein